MKEGTTFVGLDAHMEAISVAVLLPGLDKDGGVAVRQRGRVQNHALLGDQ